MKDTASDGGLVVIFGGRSEIGVEVAKRLARGADVVLAARGADRLGAEVDALSDAGATAVHTCEFDADDLASHEPVVASIVDRHGAIGTAVVAFGILGDQARAEVDPAHAAAIVHTDFTAQVSLLTALAAVMRSGTGGREEQSGKGGREEQSGTGGREERSGTGGNIVVFSSIAGARVRRANYVYGSAKAGLDGFARGLTDALHGTGVHVLLVRPGFVIGRMTEGMSPAPLSSTPAQVADATVSALRKGRREVWVPTSLGLLAFGLKMTPRFIWRRLSR